MICNHCLARIGQHSSRITRRLFTASAITREQAVSAQTTTSTNPRPNDKPAATSTSAAQPFSAGAGSQLKGGAAQVTRVPSSAPEGMVLKGINFLKNQNDPVAKADHEYPDWLWTVLDNKVTGKDDADGEGDLFSKSKKQRRKAAKALRKRQLQDPDSMIPKVPLHEQTIDIYAGDGSLDGAKDAVAARQELTKAMRAHRRSKIKETNFLKAMG